MDTTLNQIKQHEPCSTGWAKLLKSLGKTKADDKPLSLAYILKSNGIKDAVWALRCLKYKDYCLFNADVAESVLYIFEEKFPEDKRPRDTIEAIRKFYRDEITRDELNAAADDAFTADVNANAYAAAYAAYDAADNAYAYAAAGYAADAKWKEIEQLFIKHFGEKE